MTFFHKIEKNVIIPLLRNKPFRFISFQTYFLWNILKKYTNKNNNNKYFLDINYVTHSKHFIWINSFPPHSVLWER